MDKTAQYYLDLFRKERAAKEEAAKVGLQLCEENGLLTSRVEALKKQHVQELTAAEQEKYSLNIKLSQKCQVEIAQASELDATRDQMEKQTKELEHYKVTEKEMLLKITELKKEKEELEDAYHNVQSENRKQEDRIAFLANQVAEARSLAEAMACNKSFEEEENKLQLEVVSLSEKNLELQQMLEEVGSDLKTFKEREEHFRQLYHKAQEDMEIKNDQISSYYTLLQDAKEEKEELLCQIETMKAQAIDSDKRGNSLFAEVDDNRHLLMQKLGILQIEHKSLEEKYQFSLRKEQKFKQQMATLLSMTAESVSTSYVSKVEQQLEDSKNELKDLTFKLKEANTKIVALTSQASRQLNRSSSPVSFDEDYKCLRIMYDQIRQKKEVAEKELEDLRLLKVVETDKFLDCQRRLFVAEHSLQKATAENVKLRLKLQEQSTASNGNKTCKESRPHIIRTEKIPGFEPKQEASQPATERANENKEIESKEIYKTCAKRQTKKVTISDDVQKIELNRSAREETAANKVPVITVPAADLNIIESPSQCEQQ